jgi:hypothetical protein
MREVRVWMIRLGRTDRLKERPGFRVSIFRFCEFLCISVRNHL